MSALDVSGPPIAGFYDMFVRTMNWAAILTIFLYGSCGLYAAVFVVENRKDQSGFGSTVKIILFKLVVVAIAMLLGLIVGYIGGATIGLVAGWFAAALHGGLPPWLPAVFGSFYSCMMAYWCVGRGSSALLALGIAGDPAHD